LGYVVDEVARKKVFCLYEYFGFVPPVSFHQCFLPIFHSSATNVIRNITLATGSVVTQDISLSPSLALLRNV
jgi:hypothetical protein